jgi:hypothetical protein
MLMLRTLTQGIDRAQFWLFLNIRTSVRVVSDYKIAQTGSCFMGSMLQ